MRQKAHPVYISDLDGTLLTNSATLSDFSRMELCRLLSEGLNFSVASARSVISMQSILRGVPIKLPVVEFNGAFISDLQTGRHETINSIDSAVVKEVYALIESFGPKPFISTHNGTEDCLYYCDILNEGMQWYVNDRTIKGDRRLRRSQNAKAALREQVVCLTSIGTAEMLAELYEAVLERHGAHLEAHLFENHYSPGWYWFTVHDSKATKANAVRTVLEAQGLNNSELVVFGDHINDLKLFSMATEAIAVSNANPAAIKQATRIIGSNEEDSVVKYICEHWSLHQRRVSGLTACSRGRVKAAP